MHFGLTPGRSCPITRMLYRRCLKAMGIIPGGGQERTASGVNGLMKEWGGRDQPAAQSFVVSGQVRREDGLPLQGMGVRAVYEADAGSLRLGEDTTDAEGRYTIRYEPVPGIDSINLRVTVFDADGQPLHDSNVISEAKTLEVRAV